MIFATALCFMATLFGSNCGEWATSYCQDCSTYTDSRQASEMTMPSIEQVIIDTKKSLDSFADEMYNSVKNTFLGSETIEAMDAVENIIGKLQKIQVHQPRNFKGNLYQMPRIFLVALLKTVHDHMNKKFMAICPPVHMDPKSFAMAKRNANYAVKIYSASWAWDAASVAQEMGINNQSNILFTWFQDPPNGPYCPKFMIFLDHASESVVIAIRGTFSLNDVVIDVKGHQVKFLDGYAHAGLLKGAKTLLNLSKKTLKDALDKYPNYKLVVTGHSLGAGTAILVTMDLLAGNSNIIDPNRTRIKCIALAPPPVYRSRSSLSDMYKYAKNIDIFVYGQDFIPRLSLATMAKLMASMQYLVQAPMDISQVLTLVTGWDTSSAKSAKLELLSKILERVDQDQFPPLEHPGRTIHLRKVNQDKVRLFSVPKHYFSHSLFLLDAMVTDHLHASYQEAFNKVQL